MIFEFQSIFSLLIDSKSLNFEVVFVNDCSEISCEFCSFLSFEREMYSKYMNLLRDCVRRIMHFNLLTRLYCTVYEKIEKIKWVLLH